MKSNGSQWFHNIWHEIRNNTHKNKTSHNINANVYNNNQINKNHNYGSDNYTNSNYKQYFSGSRYVTDFITTFCVIHTVTQLGIGYSICVGPSMLPTLDKDGQIVLIDKFSYKVLCADYKVGDVVVSRAKEDPTKSKTYLFLLYDLLHVHDFHYPNELAVQRLGATPLWPVTIYSLVLLQRAFPDYFSPILYEPRKGLYGGLLF